MESPVVKSTQMPFIRGEGKGGVCDRSCSVDRIDNDKHYTKREYTIHH